MSEKLEDRLWIFGGLTRAEVQAIRDKIAASKAEASRDVEGKTPTPPETPKPKVKREGSYEDFLRNINGRPRSR